MSAPAIISSGTAAGGPPVGGSGTSSPSTIPRWTGASTLGDSGLTDDGTTITAANRALSWTRTSGLVGTFNRQDGNEAILALATSGAVRGYVGAGASKAFNVFNAAATSELVTVLNSGNVGIGTASPGSRVSVRSNTTSAGATPIYTIQANRQNSDTAGFLIGMDGNLDAALAVNGDSRSIRFGKDVSATFTEWGRFDSAGRLIVGSSTSPGLATGFITAVGTSAYLATWKTLATQGGCLLGSGADPVEIWRTSGTFGSETYTKILFADTSNNLILNTANTGATIQAAGTSQGLKLQGTAGTNNTDPNVLDFYADGGTPNSGGVAWTPTLKFGGNTTGITYNTQIGRYTRIGNMVFASCYIRLTSKGTATGAATIDGLPTCVNLAGFYAAGAIGYTAAITSTGTMQINMLANQTQLTIRQVTAVGVNTAVTDTDFANGSEIIVSISYPVN